MTPPFVIGSQEYETAAALAEGFETCLQSLLEARQALSEAQEEVQSLRQAVLGLTRALDTANAFAEYYEDEIEALRKDLHDARCRILDLNVTLNYLRT